MKITAVHVQDFKRINEVKISPEADKVLVLIGGSNAQGKSSLLDALSSALGGKTTLPAEPVRRGAEQAEIRVEIDGGALVVKRTISADGDSVLEVREDGVKVRSPQALLDRLVAGRFLDPLEFLAKPAKDQRATLLTLVGDAERLAELDRKRVRAFDKRTEVGRDLKKAEGELARLPVVTPAEPVDVAALTLESQKIEGHLRERDAVAARLSAARAARKTADDEVERARRALADAEARQDAAFEAVKAAETASAAMSYVDEAEQRRDAILFELRNAQAHNTKVAADAATAKRRAEAEAEVKLLRETVDGCTAAIDEIDQRKAAILAGAELPVDGLGIDDTGVTLAGIPLAQASGAERMRVAIAIASAASPNLRDIWVRDASLLDETSMALLEKYAAAAGVRLWLERVGNRDPGAIVIHDGRVAS